MERNEEYTLYFDLETNGLPLDRKVTDYRVTSNWPYIIQLAFMLCDGKGETIDSFCEYIQPDGWTIPDEPGSWWDKQGFTMVALHSEGVPILVALVRFLHAMAKAHNVVTYNGTVFDVPIVKASCVRENMSMRNLGYEPKDYRYYDPLEAMTEICKLPKPEHQRHWGGYKWPKLEEAYQHLFASSFQNAHDALADVKALKEIHEYLISNNLY